MLPLQPSLSGARTHRVMPDAISENSDQSTASLIKSWEQWAKDALPGSGELRDIAVQQMKDCAMRQAKELDLRGLNLSNLPETLPPDVNSLLLEGNHIAEFPTNLPAGDYCLQVEQGQNGFINQRFNEAVKVVEYIKEKLPLPENVNAALDSFDGDETFLKQQPGLKALLTGNDGLARLERHLQHYDTVKRQLDDAISQKDIHAIRQLVESDNNNQLINPFRLITVSKDSKGNNFLLCSQSPHDNCTVRSGRDVLYTNIREGSLPGDVMVCQETVPKKLCFDKQKISVKGIDFFTPREKQASGMIKELIEQHKNMLLRRCRNTFIKQHPEYADLARKSQKTNKKNEMIIKMPPAFYQELIDAHPQLAETRCDDEAIKNLLYEEKNYPDYEHLKSEAQEYIKSSIAYSDKQHYYQQKKSSSPKEYQHKQKAHEKKINASAAVLPELEMICYLGKSYPAKVTENQGELTLNFMTGKTAALPFKSIHDMVLKPNDLVSATLIRDNLSDDIAVIQENLNTNLDEPFSLHKLLAAQHNFRIDNPPDTLIDELSEDRYAEQRIDLRHLPFVTIDGVHTQIIDDALYAERQKNGSYDLYVAIASTAAFIEPNTLLEQEARNRGQNIYLPGMVSTMLPDKISRQLGTLSPQEDKKALVCKMTIDSQGELDKESVQFMHATVRSRAKLDYDTVSAHLAEGDSLSEVPGEICTLLHEIAQKRRAIIGDSPYFTRNDDYSVNVNSETGKFLAVTHKPRGSADDLVQDLMITANIAAGSWLGEKLKRPAIYRMHTGFSQHDRLKEVLSNENITLKNDIASTDGFREVLTQLESGKLSDAQKKKVLHYLSSATYSPQPQPHLGIGTQFYLPWTSPLRRYADLVNHEVVSEAIKTTVGEYSQEKNSHHQQWLNSVINTEFTRQLAEQQNKIKHLQNSVERAVVLDFIKSELEAKKILLTQAVITEAYNKSLFKVTLPHYKISTLINLSGHCDINQQIPVIINKVNDDDIKRPIEITPLKA